ncbi:hypothetical protein H0E87_006129 [Populus deltoides]|uniref:Ribosomal protein/NADH dehydrogenase domain-containing protein n=1 Tax=Populus deltoides TaxID=3696 RepID=A0A8T2Z5V2_POPDE|nr:hypothetical protein H0E87_006129 [Populus deltoides]
MAWRGQLSKNLKELRILPCQSSPSSSTTRTFIERSYKDLKTLNPKLPILIRECNGIEPQLWARYGIPLFSLSLSCLLSHFTVSLNFSIELLDFAVTSADIPHAFVDFGVERGVRLEGLSEAQISKALEELGKVGASLKDSCLGVGHPLFVVFEFDLYYNMALACFLPVE